jgi:hypothetical protein
MQGRSIDFNPEVAVVLHGVCAIEYLRAGHKKPGLVIETRARAALNGFTG